MQEIKFNEIEVGMVGLGLMWRSIIISLLTSGHSLQAQEFSYKSYKLMQEFPLGELAYKEHLELDEIKTVKS